MTDIPKIKEGDKITFVVDRSTFRQVVDGHVMLFTADEIIHHEPAPFDWSTVKPGMAFEDTFTRRFYLYIGPHFSVNENYRLIKDKNMGVFRAVDWTKDTYYVLSLSYFERAPAYDIEVKP